MSNDITDDIVREYESALDPDGIESRRPVSVVTPGKLSDILERLLKQAIEKGWASESLSEFDFDVKYDPVKCVISYRMPLYVQRYGISIRSDKDDI